MSMDAGLTVLGVLVNELEYYWCLNFESRHFVSSYGRRNLRRSVLWPVVLSMAVCLA
jgi:hypothetical protein